MKLHNRIKLWMVEKYRVLHGCPRDIDEERFDAGFSLLESLVSIVVFALVITAVGSSLVMAHRINARSEVLMQEQLKVSRAVEGIMASGVDPRLDIPRNENQGNPGTPSDYLDYYDSLYDDVNVEVDRGKITLGSETKDAAFYKVVVTSKDEKFKDLVSVTTYVHPVEHLDISEVPGYETMEEATTNDVI